MTMIVQISACWIIPHFFFFLSTYQMVQADYPFSSCFHFSEQLPIFSTSLKDKVPFYFKMRDNFLFFNQKGECIRTCTSSPQQSILFVFLHGVKWIMCIYLCLAILSLSVFSAASTSAISKPFQCPLPTAPLPSKVLRVESPPPRPLPSSDLSLLTSNYDTRHIIVQTVNLPKAARHFHIRAPTRPHAPPKVSAS